MANPLQFQTPHIGATGVIQNPGLGGALAQAYSGLPQILLALQEQQRRQAQEQLNQQYLQGQLANLQTDNERQAAAAALAGAVGGQVNQANQAALQPSLGIFGLSGQAQGTIPQPSIQDVLGSGMLSAPGASEKFLSQDWVKERLKTEAENKKVSESRQRALKAIGKLDPKMQDAIRPLIEAGDALPAGLQSKIFDRIASGGADPELMSRIYSATESRIAGIGDIAKTFGVDPAIFSAAGIDLTKIRPNLGYQTMVAGIQLKPADEGEAKRLDYFNTSLGAEPEIRRIASNRKNLPNPAELYVLMEKPITWQYLVDKASPVWTPYLNFLEPRGRSLSQAVIKDSEFKGWVRQYLPVEGDSDATIAFKERQREKFINTQGFLINRLLNQQGLDYRDLISNSLNPYRSPQP